MLKHKKVEKLRIQALNIYHLDSFPILTNKFKDRESFSDISMEYEEEIDNHIYIIQLISKYSALNLYIITTHS